MASYEVECLWLDLMVVRWEPTGCGATQLRVADARRLCAGGSRTRPSDNHLPCGGQRAAVTERSRELN
ncbi:MAG: hypothetical protein H9W81_09865 [Enterococcus sp.]|nr:hypothetical protein [Enterococcus sp.]